MAENFIGFERNLPQIHFHVLTYQNQSVVLRPGLNGEVHVVQEVVPNGNKVQLPPRIHVDCLGKIPGIEVFAPRIYIEFEAFR
jgi:hypothetical protein